MNDNTNGKIGTVSLWASILGIVVPILIALLVHMFVKEDPRAYHKLCGLLFAGTQLVALVTGIIGRRSPSGKAGLGVSAVCIVVIAVLLLLPGSDGPHAPTLPEPPQVSQP